MVIVKMSKDKSITIQDNSSANSELQSHYVYDLMLKFSHNSQTYLRLETA